jgi:hypothetical protein
MVRGSLAITSSRTGRLCEARTHAQPPAFSILGGLGRLVGGEQVIPAERTAAVLPGEQTQVVAVQRGFDLSPPCGPVVDHVGVIGGCCACDQLVSDDFRPGELDQVGDVAALIDAGAVPPSPRGPAVLTRPVRSLRPRSPPLPAARPYHPGPHPISGAVHYGASSRVHSRSPARSSPRLVVPLDGSEALGLFPGLRTPAGKTCGARQSGDGHRALTRNYASDILGPPFREFPRNVRPRVARSART